MATADATILPPAYDLSTDRDSVKHLEDVGVGTILGAMIEQKRRASQPSFAAIDLETLESSGASSDERDERRESNENAGTRSDVFLKAR
jgi:hypothetical protein